VNPLSKRARSVLYAVVTEFIGSGEPVGSRTLSKKYGFSLSPATIRNVLADLEDAGYLAQPHTSAGRVPTESAFRLFIDALMRVRRLPEDDADRIHEWLADLRPDADIPRETGKLLSDLSGSPAVVLRSPAESRRLLKLRFITTRPGELLAVVVFEDTTVENRFLRVDKPISDAELERLHGLLEEAVPGHTLGEVREAVARGMSERRDELKALHELGHALLRSTSESVPRPAEVVIEGQALLFDKPEFGDPERLRELLLALEARERLEQRLAVLRAHVRRVHDRQATGGQPLGGHEVQDLEGLFRGVLRRLVVRHQAATEIRREDLGTPEVLQGKRRLAGPGRTDQHDQ
jgi:heat-inducible transcriptional repressor